MAAISEVHVKVVPELDPKFEALLGTATQDTLAKLDAGAALVYAMYHCPKDQVETFFGAMPDGVKRAYMRASDAYRVNSRDPKVNTASPSSPEEG